MSGLQLEIKPFGFDKARDAINGIILRGRTLRLPFEAFGRYLAAQSHEHFERQETPEGDPWQALSPATIKARQERDRHRKGGAQRAFMRFQGLGEEEKALFVTGRLFAQSANYRATDEGLAFGTNYHFPGGVGPAILFLGGKAGRGHKVTIPARPWFGVTETDADRGADLMIEYLARL